jgi:hypothetical protein
MHLPPIEREKSMALIANIKHYLGPGLSLIPIPSAEATTREFLGRLVKAVTSRDPDDLSCFTQIPCPNRLAGCEGDILAGYDQEIPSVIHWSCTSCDESGLLSGWENTVWDNRWK